MCSHPECFEWDRIGQLVNLRTRFSSFCNEMKRPYQCFCNVLLLNYKSCILNIFADHFQMHALQFCFILRFVFPRRSCLFQFIYQQYENLLAQSITVNMGLHYFAWLCNFSSFENSALHHVTTTLQLAKLMQTWCSQTVLKSKFISGSKWMETSACLEDGWNASKSVKHNSIVCKMVM